MARGRTWLILVLMLALILRLIAAFVVQQRVGDRQLCLISGDAEGYWQLAQNIAAGQEFSLYEPPRRIHRMPGFPVVLALSLTLFGKSAIAARFLLAIVGTAACGAVYLLGRRLFDEKVGLLACAFTAISPVMIGFSVLLLSETLFALTLTLSVWCAAKWLSESETTVNTTSHAWVWVLATGFSVALATYVRPSWLLAGPGLAMLAVVVSKQRVQRTLEAAVMLLTLYGTLLPWAVRNHAVCGHWIVTTLWSGASLYDGLSPEANGDSDMEFFDRDKLMESQSEWDVDQHYNRAAWQFAKENPGRAIELTFVKLWRYWKPWPNAAQFGGIGPAVMVSVFFLPLMFLAARGFWVARHRPWVWMLTLGPILYFAAIHTLFVGSLRYRLPAEYPLCVLAAAGCLKKLERKN
ncbi:MAG: glycosyltransferase family 39 protein [Planctomycetia bacterium]|nr:glycosyltransferase family 39 protein [Planctomycetia bacterium]